MDVLPRWRGLNHFKAVMHMSFTDGSKNEDISKVDFPQIIPVVSASNSQLQLVLFAAHNILCQEDSPLGYLLLKCLRRYIVLDTYAAMEVHTTETIAAGRKELQNFSDCMNVSYLCNSCIDILIIKDQEYIEAAGDTDSAFADKNWEFIKMHLHDHLFDDIQAKGVTRNYSTKPNEKLHGPLKDSYLDRTNFKNVASQVGGAFIFLTAELD
jgi:hypothetical protein